MNPIGSVEKTWGRFLNEAYLRRTYLQGRMHVLAETVARTCGDGCTYLRGRLHVLAETVALYLRGQMLNEAFPANGCGDGCTYLRERLQCFASERGKTGAEIVSPLLDERKGGSIRVTIVPRKILLSGQEPR